MRSTAAHALGTQAAPGRSAPARARRWAGVWLLVRLAARTGWKGLLGWPAAIAVLVTAVTASVADLYDDPAARELYAQTLGASPMTWALNGPAYDLHTVGGIAVYEVGFFGLLVLPAIGIHLAVSRTRRPEESGVVELVTATRVGRLAPLGAALMVVTGSVALSGVLSGVGLVVVGLPPGSSARYAIGIALLVLVHSGVGFVAAQICRGARASYMLALSAQLAMYLVRAVVDGLELSTTWATPMGWFAQIRPFGEQRVWPILALAALSAVFMALAVSLREHRDLGAGLLQERNGAPEASRALRSPAGLLWRTSRSSFGGWMAASLAWGVGLGLLARDMQALVDTNPALATFLGASEAPEKAMTAVGATILALAAAAMALQGVGQLVGEEQSGRLAALLATRTSRLNWWASAASVIALEVLAVLVMGGLALGGGTAMAIGDPGAVTSGIVACVAYIPAVLVLGAAGGLLFTVQPAAAHLGWVLLAWSAIVALLGDTLQLPLSVRQLSPLEHVGRVPVQDPQLAASAALSALAVLLVLAGGLALTRRDLRHN